MVNTAFNKKIISSTFEKIRGNTGPVSINIPTGAILFSMMEFVARVVLILMFSTS